jgi:DNA-binding response OmpR family regulator
LRILIVEDDKQIASFMQKGLSENGFAVDHADNGEDGLHLALNEPYDVAIIDLMLPKLDGLSLIHQMRQHKIATPVIILSARSSVEDRVSGLQTGADDYLTKPFAFAELLARVQALIRRSSNQTEPTILTVQDLSLDLLKRVVIRAGQKIDLQPREFALLEYLMRHAGTVVSKEIAIRTGIAEPILKTFNSLESGWLSVTQFFSRAWLEACRGILEAWNRVTKAIKTAQSWIAEKVVGVMAFFDSSIDEDAVKKAVREEFDTEKDSLDKEMQDLERGYDREIGEMNKKNQADEQSLKKDQSDRLAELHRQESIGNQGRLNETRKAKSDIDLKRQEEKKALEKQSTADLSESAQALKKAREEWQASIVQASNKRNDQSNNAASAGTPNPQENLKEKIKSAGRATQAALGKIDVRGTFNVMSLRAFASAGISDAVASNTAEMVKEQKKTNRKLDEMQDSDEATFE